MRPEYYSDLYKQYATYVRSYDLDNKICKIACGPNVDDYNWTEKVMEHAGKFMNALTLHYYTHPKDKNLGKGRGSATNFDKNVYYTTLNKALKMEELISNHLQIMNKYDPKHNISLIVDEWGTWYDVEPGTNPGFLYQQNTMRDAMVAALTLDIFSSHSDRVSMANIAQTANVLQAVVLTDGIDMLLTPTYHVFDLYKAHQNATRLGIHIESDLVGNDENQLLQISATASLKADTLTITLSNTSEIHEAEVEINLIGAGIKGVEGHVLTGEINSYNDFQSKEHVVIRQFDAIKNNRDHIIANLPACCVTELKFPKINC